MFLICLEPDRVLYFLFYAFNHCFWLCPECQVHKITSTNRALEQKPLSIGFFLSVSKLT